MLKQSHIGVNQDRDLEYEQILSGLLDPQDPEQSAFRGWASRLSLSAGQATSHLFLLPLGITLLDPRLLPVDRLSPSGWIFLEEKLLALCRQRDWQDTGLPYLLGAFESLLPEASYWSSGDRQSLIEPAFIALLAQALDTLIHHTSAYGGRIDELVQYSELLHFGVNDLLWNEDYGLYLPYDGDEQQQIESESIGGMLCLLAPLPDQEQAEAMYRCLAFNFVHPDHYYFPLECLPDSKSEGWIDALVNYLLLQGLLRYEFTTTAEALRRQSQEGLHTPGRISSLKKEAPAHKPGDGYARALARAFRRFPTVHPSNQE